MSDPDKRLELARAALQRSHLFSLAVFRGKLEVLLDEAEAELLGRDVLPMAGAGD